MSTYLQISIPIEPPEPIGTAKGVHVYLEFPDQSSGTPSLMDGSTDMSGTYDLSGSWAPADIGKFPYTGTGGVQQIQFLSPAIIPDEIGSGANARIYAVAYSDTVDPPVVQANQPGASPNVVLALSPINAVKPGAGSNVTPIQVRGVTASVGANINLSGKVQTEIAVVVDLTGVPSPPPADWGFQIQGYINGDLSSPVALLSDVFSSDGLVPAGPDNDPDPHTFLYDTPTSNQVIVVYAVSGRIITTAEGRPGLGIRKNSQFHANLIVPGVTPSSTITVGVATGVIDLTAAVQALLHSSVGTRTGEGVFGVLDAGIATAHLQDLLVTTAKLANLAITDGKVNDIAAGKITAGTLVAGVIYGGTINATQINAGTLNVGVIYGGTINCSQINTGTLSAVNMSGGTLSLNSNGITTTINNATDATFGFAGGIKVSDNSVSSLYSLLDPHGFRVNKVFGDVGTISLAYAPAAGGNPEKYGLFLGDTQPSLSSQNISIYLDHTNNQAWLQMLQAIGGQSRVQFRGLPTSSAGLSSGELWCDTSDSNRVKQV